MICEYCNSEFNQIDIDILESAAMSNWKYYHCNEQRLEEKKQRKQQEEKELIELKIELLRLQNNQPERSKREDSQKCEMRCSEHCGNIVRDK